MKHSLYSFVVLSALITGQATADEIAPYDTTSIQFQMGGYEYAFPRNVLNDAHEGDCNVNQASLRLLWPTLEGRTKENEEKVRYPSVGRKNKSIRIFLQKPQNGRYADIAIEDNLKSAFDVYQIMREPLPNAFYDLNIYRAKYPPLTHASKHMILVNKKEDSILGFIICGEPGLSGVCRQHFAFNNLVVKLSYDFHLLYRWNEIEASVENWLEKHTITRVNEPQKECNY